MKRSIKNKKTMLAVLIIALGVLGAAGYVKWQQQSANHQPDTKIHAGPTKDTPPTSTESASTSTQPNPSHPSSSKLAKPIGPNNNVSSVSLSGVTGMESTCRSIPGASCYIQASKDGKTTKVSGAKTVGSEAYNDGVILNWDANKLEVGSWSIQAVASKDGQSAYSDPQKLEVKS